MNSSNNLLILQEDISNPWNSSRFSICRHPQYVGTISSKAAFLANKMSCLDMLIKKPFGELKIPYSDKIIVELVDRSLSFEKTINPNWMHYYTYLTIDQRVVKADFTHRREGIHFDGMQGVKYPQKLPACHSYVVSNCLPTQFYVNHFSAKDLSELKDNWYFEFEKQAERGATFHPEPFDIFLMTAYQVHEAVRAVSLTKRTFMRVEFTLKKYNRIGNTFNPLLATDWKFIDREIPVHLRKGNFRDTGWRNEDFNGNFS